MPEPSKIPLSSMYGIMGGKPIYDEFYGYSEFDPLSSYNPYWFSFYDHYRREIEKLVDSASSVLDETIESYIRMTVRDMIDSDLKDILKKAIMGNRERIYIMIQNRYYSYGELYYKYVTITSGYNHLLSGAVYTYQRILLDAALRRDMSKLHISKLNTCIMSMINPDERFIEIKLTPKMRDKFINISTGEIDLEKLVHTVEKKFLEIDIPDEKEYLLRNKF